MLRPSIFGENLFDDFFNDFPFFYDDRAARDVEKKLYGHRANQVMKTDVKELKDGYEAVSYTHLDVYKRQVIYSTGVMCRQSWNTL